MQIDVLLGLQWGDEGKGKIVDYLAPSYDMVARFQGGPNAGHTLIINGKKTVLHTIPSGIFHDNLINLIGNGVVIDPITLEREIRQLEEQGLEIGSKLRIARKAHLILPTHRMLDAASEAAKGEAKIGSTLRGIGPTYMDKTGRNGLRVGDVESPQFRQAYNTLKEKHLNLLNLYPPIDFDLEAEEQKWMESLETMRKITFVDGEYFLNTSLSKGQKILAEGAQGSMLDIDFGTYPFVTSSNTLSSGVCGGLGVSPKQIGRVIGISKAYCTRVGSGPFPTELEDETGERLRREGGEFGATTGRPRRCGWLDLVQLHYTIMLNGVTDIALTKADVLNNFEEIKVARAYSIDGRETDELPFDLSNPAITPIYESIEGWNRDLSGMLDFEDFPAPLRHYVSHLEKSLRTPISFVSTGPEREALVVKPAN